MFSCTFGGRRNGHGHTHTHTHTHTQNKKNKRMQEMLCSLFLGPLVFTPKSLFHYHRHHRMSMVDWTVGFLFLGLQHRKIGSQHLSWRPSLVFDVCIFRYIYIYRLIYEDIYIFYSYIYIYIFIFGWMMMWHHVAWAFFWANYFVRNSVSDVDVHSCTFKLCCEPVKRIDYCEALGDKHILGGGFKHFLFSPRSLGKWSNVTNIFQMGWHHQLAFIWEFLIFSCLLLMHFIMTGRNDITPVSVIWSPLLEDKRTGTCIRTYNLHETTSQVPFNQWPISLCLQNK